MTVINKVYSSNWWKEAMLYPDRHYPKDSGVMLSNHLLSVMENSIKIFNQEPSNVFYKQLYQYLQKTNFDLVKCKSILQVVALLHDIGKPQDNKNEEIEHPIKKIQVKKRHQVLGVYSAVEILKDQSEFSESEKSLIYNLIDEHDTPFSWFRQFEKTNIIPDFKSWKKLDNKICHDRNDNYGIIMLTLFKLADIDGHESISDLIWFIEQLNQKYLNLIDKSFPIVTEKDII